jgi:hypothetical protein
MSKSQSLQHPTTSRPQDIRRVRKRGDRTTKRLPKECWHYCGYRRRARRIHRSPVGRIRGCRCRSATHMPPRCSPSFKRPPTGADRRGSCTALAAVRVLRSPSRGWRADRRGRSERGGPHVVTPQTHWRAPAPRNPLSRFAHPASAAPRSRDSEWA